MEFSPSSSTIPWLFLCLSPAVDGERSLLRNTLESTVGPMFFYTRIRVESPNVSKDGE